MSKTVTIQAQQKWEYTLVTRKTETAMLIELNVLGQDGWEMVDMLFYKNLKGVMEWTAFLKRPCTGQTTVKQAAEKGPVVLQPTDAPAKSEPTEGGFDLGEEDFKFESE